MEEEFDEHSWNVYVKLEVAILCVSEGRETICCSRHSRSKQDVQEKPTKCIDWWKREHSIGQQRQLDKDAGIKEAPKFGNKLLEREREKIIYIKLFGNCCFFSPPYTMETTLSFKILIPFFKISSPPPSSPELPLSSLQ